ncbi:MAG TPA: hypothetical protein P5016_14880, partial [Verrucomicrobiales bacterium]|nr:hypothetical protein [Verrucomicrobiales bacterium]
MKTYLKLTLVLSLLALAGCGKEEQKSPEQPQAETSKRPVQESPPDWTGDDHPSQSVGSKYRWDQEQILKRHEELAMKPLPAYINEVWGAGGMPKEGDVLSDWAFVVPKDRIGDFEDYLRNLGVPEEFMTGDSPYRSGKQENWKAP